MLSISIGVIGTLENLDRFRAGGFSGVITDFPETPIGILDPLERGNFANWCQVARWMLRHTTSELVMVAEDGLEFSPDAATAVLRGPTNGPDLGYASLFTPELMAARQPKAFEGRNGWCEVSPNRSCAGASKCSVFTRAGLSRLLETPIQDGWTVPELVEAHPEQAHEIDAILADAAAGLGLRTFHHNPSLCRMLARPIVEDWRRGSESRALGWLEPSTEAPPDEPVSEVSAEPAGE